MEKTEGAVLFWRVGVWKVTGGGGVVPSQVGSHSLDKTAGTERETLDSERDGQTDVDSVGEGKGWTTTGV